MVYVIVPVLVIRSHLRTGGKIMACPICGSTDLDVDDTGEYELRCQECGEGLNYEDLDEEE
jgi:uncharacterized Zn finger protein